MQTSRTNSSQLKKQFNTSIGKQAIKKSSSKLFEQIENLFNKLLGNNKSLSLRQLKECEQMIEQYYKKLSKCEDLKKNKKYMNKLAECERLLFDAKNNSYESQSKSSMPSKQVTVSESQSSLNSNSHQRSQSNQYNTVQLDLLRSTVQSKQTILKHLYQKQRGKTKGYEQVIKHQQKQIQLITKRLQDVQDHKSKYTSRVMRSIDSHTNKQNLDDNSSRFQQGTLKQPKKGIYSSLIFDKTQKIINKNEQFKPSQQPQLYSIKLQQFQRQILSLQKQNTSYQYSQKSLHSALKQQQQTIGTLTHDVKQLQQQLAVKQQIMTQLIYEKQNYSDAYLKLKQQAQQMMTKLQQYEDKIQKYENQEKIKEENTLQKQEEVEEIVRMKEDEINELTNIIFQLKEDLNDQKERNQMQRIAIENEEGKLRRVCNQIKQFEDQNKQLKLKLRTSEHKMEMYMEKYYKLQNQCLVREEKSARDMREFRDFSARGTTTNRRLNTDERSFDRSQKLITAHTYEISCDRTDRQYQREKQLTMRQRDTNRKRKVLSQIKSMVREKRNTLFE